ncbi:hypothetical protein C8R45DRAFT_1144725 [Mycena sanguinolenta]|nr:hypothetical protein C8R45DRAFT_1144725 [Mycena sanguinolenta]
MSHSKARYGDKKTHPNNKYLFDPTNSSSQMATALQRERNRFPPMYTDATPPRAGTMDARGLRNPSYTYGWIVLFQQLLDAAREVLGEAPRRLQGGVGERWEGQGYADKYGAHARPELRVFYDPRTDSVLVDITNNHSAARRALAEPEFVAACRDTLGHATGTERAPVWIRSDLSTVPEGYEYEFQGERRSAAYAMWVR